MKNTAIFFVVLFVLLSLTSCNIANKAPEDTVNPNITVSEQTNPEETITFEIDLYDKILKTYETWLIKGFSAYESGTSPADMTEFFSISENISYLTLYDHMFEFDGKTSTAIAEALFKFICDNYGTEALFDLDKRVEYKNAYLESLGLPPTYTQEVNIEKFFASEFSSTNGSEFPHHIAFDNIHYHFKSFDGGYDYDYKPFHFHEYIYKNTQGMIKMIEKIKDLGLGEYFNTERDFNFYMVLGDGLISYTTFKDGRMYITNMTVSLHEAIHAMGIGDCQNIWLSEGLCDYFCNGFDFNTMYDRSSIILFQAYLNGDHDHAIEAGDQVMKKQKRIAQAYVDAGGVLDVNTPLDWRLLFDISSRFALADGNENTIGAARNELNANSDGLIGLELTYTQTASMVFYLANTYGIETVVAACVSDDIPLHFGKTYEELKEEWIDYLG